MAFDLGQLSAEQIRKGMTCKSLDEFKTFAREEGFDLGDEEARAVFEKMYATELSNEELAEISGGTSWDSCNEDDCPDHVHIRIRKRRH